MISAERNYPVHDNELLAMRYALIKFRVCSLGEKMSSVYTDHASLRTVVKTPHLSQRMAHWSSFFSEYNFVVFHKPGKNSILANARSRRPNYNTRRDMGHHPGSADEEDDGIVCASYTNVSFNSGIINSNRHPSEGSLPKLPKPTCGNIKRYARDGLLLTYTMDVFDPQRVVIPADDDLRARLVHETYVTTVGGHLDLFQLLGTRLLMSTAAHPETDGQAERNNRVP
ncbi:unnamed protein product [Peronospora belbahrii]|uniref:Reverse transcriptase RNase H-like domain-containing protein n=1 Tax=Peronospora belbahrii TaxID=622444 RepID=A0ABN8D7W7_9STRA|nr:unnamed protein product [Peronospora belbahrii]